MMKIKKIIAKLLGVACAVTAVAAFSVFTPVAHAEIDKNNYVLNSFQDSFVSFGCDVSEYAVTYSALKNNGDVFKTYNGYNAKFRTGGIVETKKAINVTDNTENDVIFECIPAVENQGTKEFYKFSVYFTDEQNENTYIKLEFKGNGDYYMFVNASAKDGDTIFEPASKHWQDGTYRSDQGFQVGFGLSGSGASHNFQSLKMYWDNTAKTIEVGSSRGSTIVRDFKLSDSELGIGGYTGTAKFGGFPSGKVKIKVVAENVVTSYANMNFISADGEKFARPFGLRESMGNAMTGDEVTLPEITEGRDVKNGVALNVSDLTIETEVKDPSGNAVALSGNKFTVLEEGDYVARFYCEQDSVTYVSEYKTAVVKPTGNDITESFNCSGCETSPYAKTATLASGGKVNGYFAAMNDSSNSVVKTVKAIDVSNKTKNDVLFEFLPQTIDLSSKNLALFDVIISDSEDASKNITLTLSARTASTYMGVTSKASDGGTTFNQASYTISGYNSGALYGFNTSNSFWNMKETLKIYWDNATKSLYLSPYRTDTCTGLVRDFRLSDKELGVNGYTGTAKFSGFTSGKVNISLKAYRNDVDLRMYFISAGGEKFARPFGMEKTESPVAIRSEVTLPTVTDGWNVKSGVPAEITESDYTAKVLYGNEEIAVSGNKFTANKAGEYTVVYECRQDGAPYFVKQSVTVYDYYLYGAAIRVNTSDGKNGIRFYVRMDKALYENLSAKEGFASGTLVIPENKLSGALDINNATAENGVTTGKWYETEDEKYMQSVVYLYDIPAANYGDDILARGYITAEGKTYYTVSEKWSMTYVAEYAYENFGIAKEKLEEYFGVYTVTYKTAGGEIILSEKVKYSNFVSAAPTEYNGANVTGFQTEDGKAFDITADYIKGDITLIAVTES